jgi:tetratricopeptide (TPR) repeat protein
MSQSKTPASPTQLGANLQIGGGAAIVAPISAFQGAIPPNALIVLPLKKPTEELEKKLESGAVAVTPEQMWELLGFNGPAVQVQDQEGRPITIGLNDLLAGLEKHWKEDQSDLNRGRLYSQELMRHGRAAQAEKVMAKVVALGGTGEDWLGLGVAQLGAELLEKAESTLKGAQNLLPESAYPALNLGKVYDLQEKPGEARTMVEKAIATDSTCVDAWVYLHNLVRKSENEEAAIQAVEALANAPTNVASATPYIALQGVYSGDEATRPKAIEFAKKAIARDADDTLALISLSALHGQAGDLQSAIDLLQKHESKMLRDVRLANNYFEALLQTRQMEKLTKLLNALAGSPQRDVKQFAIERSRAVAQMLQQQQQRAQAVARKAAAPD